MNRRRHRRLPGFGMPLSTSRSIAWMSAPMTSSVGPQVVNSTAKPGRTQSFSWLAEIRANNSSPLSKIKPVAPTPLIQIRRLFVRISTARFINTMCAIPSTGAAVPVMTQRSEWYPMPPECAA